MSLMPLDDHIVENVLDAHFERSNPERELDGKWHPSAMFGCDRQALYAKCQMPPSEPLESKTLRVFGVGHALHEILQRAVEEAELGTTYTELTLEDLELEIKGTLDQLIEIGPDHWELWEYKSIKSKAFKYGGLPKSEHLLQAITYAMILRKQGKKVQNIRLVYVSKDDLEIGEYIYPWTDELESRVIQRLDALRAYESANTLPPRLPMKSGKRDWRCTYCRWQTQCWDIDSEEGVINRAEG